jgi:DNA-binding MarR family transcriptional regulator
MNMKSTGVAPELLSVKQRRLAGSLFSFQGLLQKHFHENVEAQTVMFFLHVASQSEPVDLTNIGKALELTKAAASRNYYRLSVGLRGTEGLDLIEAHDDPMDYRRKLITLTSKGVQVAQELVDYVISSMERIGKQS